MQKSCKFMSVWTGGTFIRWVIGLDYISLRREKFMLAEKVVWFVRVELTNFEWGHNLSRKHRLGWEGAALASDAVARAAVPRLSFFFFFFPRIRADAAQFTSNRLRFTLNRADSARIGPYRPYRIILASNRYGWNRLEMPKIGLETCRNHRNSDLRGVSCLLLSLFCESRNSNVFFKNILIVKIYRKYK